MKLRWLADKMKKINWINLILAIGVCQLAGFIGSIATVSSISSWYLLLTKPFFSPPNWIFGPVWITLYTLMGINLYLVWQKGINKKPVKYAVLLFVFHLLINSLWSIVFFGFKNIILALFVIILLWLLIIKIILVFSKIEKKAALLLVPYLIWVSFATILNASLWILNR